jgi:hypothetical protein
VKPPASWRDASIAAWKWRRLASCVSGSRWLATRRLVWLAARRRLVSRTRRSSSSASAVAAIISPAATVQMRCSRSRLASASVFSALSRRTSSMLRCFASAS